AQVLTPAPVSSLETDWVAAVTNVGRMLVFPISELPMMAKGKGNKMIGIPSDKFKSGEEYVVGIVSLSENGNLTVYSGKRHVNFNFYDMEHYEGERGRRGNKLPRGFQKVDAVTLAEE
ncbi:MAG: DNA topoisomerase IV subunit A, partial [Gammaproteobacteria bacterium]|nr:DNA topoisomerase IV subunit A [Gammaproteobacteria bacterium]